MWYHWGALMINQFKGRDVLIFGGGEGGSGTEVLAYYSLDKQNECALSSTLLCKRSRLPSVA
jgi:spermidine synthase